MKCSLKTSSHQISLQLALAREAHSAAGLQPGRSDGWQWFRLTRVSISNKTENLGDKSCKNLIENNGSSLVAQAFRLLMMQWKNFILRY